MRSSIVDLLPKSPNQRIMLGMAAALFGCLCCMMGSFLALGPQPSPTVAPASVTQIAAAGDTSTPVPTPTNTGTSAPTPTNTPTGTPTVTVTPTGTQQPTATFTSSPTPTNTPTSTPTPTPTNTPTITPTNRPPTVVPALRGPQNLAVYAKTGNVWVTNRGDDSIVEVDGNNVTRVLSRIGNVPGPNGIAIHQAGGFAYVTNRDQATVTEIDLNLKQVRQTFAVGTLPWGVAVDEAHGDVYVANFGSSNFMCIRPSSRQVLAIAGKFTQPAHVAYNTPTDAVYGISRDGQLSRLTCGASQIVRTVPDASLFDLSVNESGGRVFVTANNSRRVNWFDPGAQGSNSYPFANEPYAVESMKTCVGVVVPAEDKLYALDAGLSGVLRTYSLGKQTVGEGGQGIAYFAPADTVYVANYGADSLTAIKNPCPVNVTPVFGTPRP